MLAPRIALAAPAAIYLVRHGEKETCGAKNPELTEMGQVRARNIAAILHKARVKAMCKITLETHPADRRALEHPYQTGAPVRRHVRP